MTPTLNQQVAHKSGAQKVGLVTAILTRANGVQYGVTWDDLTERWHAADELEPYPPEGRAMGLPTVSSWTCWICKQPQSGVPAYDTDEGSGGGPFRYCAKCYRVDAMK